VCTYTPDCAADYGSDYVYNETSMTCEPPEPCDSCEDGGFTVADEDLYNDEDYLGNLAAQASGVEFSDSYPSETYVVVPDTGDPVVLTEQEGLRRVDSATASSQCLFTFHSIPQAVRSYNTGTSESASAWTTRTGDCGKVVAKIQAQARIIHTGIPPFGTAAVSGPVMDTATAAPFVASALTSQYVPMSEISKVNYHGPGTQVTYDFTYRETVKNGNYIDYCRRVVIGITITGTKVNSDSGVASPCGYGHI
jgi:hypothetical protein